PARHALEGALGELADGAVVALEGRALPRLGVEPDEAATVGGHPEDVADDDVVDRAGALAEAVALVETLELAGAAIEPVETALDRPDPQRAVGGLGDRIHVGHAQR